MTTRASPIIIVHGGQGQSQEQLNRDQTRGQAGLGSLHISRPAIQNLKIATENPLQAWTWSRM